MSVLQHLPLDTLDLSKKNQTRPTLGSNVRICVSVRLKHKQWITGDAGFV